MVIFIDVMILLTCLNFDIDIESTTIFIKLLNYRFIFGILHITTPYPPPLDHTLCMEQGVHVVGANF